MTNNDADALCSECQQPIPTFEHESNKHYHEHCKPDWHIEPNSDILEEIIHQQIENLSYYQTLQEHLTERQSEEELSELNALQNLLNVNIRPLIEVACAELNQHGFHTGVTEETATFIQDDQESSFVVGLIMHMTDIAVSDNSLVRNDINSSNTIRFYRVDNSREIECQFKNSKMQSRIYALNNRHFAYEKNHETNNRAHRSIGVQIIINDFIQYILLNRRAELSSII